ncbi:SusC/RagA family TonB-linked outer membrane protein [Euzebyella marina]|uniref:SusC/RagA family TonB-linked outer membrane protein n=1 Tax=Euzebyella marina TaxID=1761453 RepID=A0A3G2L7W9_9FLAO|nr:SusC/RagA family TonB-linked outer membrane protein [Euzebyella marina]AYN68326.1 SusC/RagA family TonB-linked outer membrane protein [Euzebyella marina]MAU72876.1 TonB-dependent receptor [Pseudozobellia sp.]MBG50591.1 TonB-dependent receptor [Pseudozobellia sp.]
MIKRLIVCFALLLGTYPLMAQDKTVTGTVTDANDGAPLPGVNVLVQGTTNGTQTDFDGNYSIEAAEGDILVFSYLGTKTQTATVGSTNTVDVAMEEDASQLDEVVVTALGIKRQEKTLTYAQQSVDSDELTKTRDPNFMNALSGKTAGVEIKKSSSGAGGSTKILLRGNKSLSGDSSPLFVIDGIPMANNKGGQPGMWGGSDSGDGLSAINPDDIESISILRGANAAVLYGSQGANGVVLITTKSGSQGKTTVTVNSSYTFEHYLELPDLQYKYGAIGAAKESWDTTPGDYQSDYVEDFFQTGHNFFNSVSVSGGTDKTQAYFSYGNISATGITPMNKYLKNNFTFKQSTKLFNDKLTITSNVIGAVESSKNRLPSGYYLNPLTGLYFFPRNRNFYNYKNNYEVFDQERNIMAQNWFVSDHHQSNPYWILNNEPQTDRRDRFIGNLTLSYDIMDNLSLQVRGNYDYATITKEQQHAATSNSTNVHPNGAWDYQKYQDKLLYTDAILNYNTDLGEDFSLNATLGASHQETKYGIGVQVNTGTLGLLYPNEFYFQNLPTNVQVQSITNGTIIKEGIFANAQIGFKEMLFLDIQGRNDWASTLALTGNDSYFYPSLGLTALLSEMFTLPEAISFLKLRGSWTQVGNEVPFNRINPQNSITANGGVSRNTTRPFLDAKPEIITSSEVGADLRFFNNRLGLDFTYYFIKSEDQYISVPTTSGQGGYTQEYINAGEITNKGVEITLNTIPIQSEDFEWSSSFNFTSNRNEVVDIGPDDERIFNLGSSEGYYSRLIEGGRYNDLYVNKFLRDDQGRIIFSEGAPRKTDLPELIGNLDPKASLGWNNSVSFKRFTFGALINAKFGGKVFSQTQSMLDGYGVSQVTADARDAGGVTVNGVDEATGAAITTVDAETWYRAIGDRNGVGEAYVYDRTNVKLSQLSVGYNFDLSNSGLPIQAASLSFIGNNLFFFYKDAPFDPELAISTNQNAQGLDNFNLPSTGTYGFNLKLTF